MIDLGLSKIAVIGAVALVVLGPERLPRIARMAGALYGRAQRYMRDVKDEVSRDMALNELKNMGQAVRDDVQSAVNEVREATLGESVSPHSSPRAYVRRTGREHWRVKTSRMPLWYKQREGIAQHVTSEAARMARHRRYTAHLQQKRHSFFN
ncbi:MAG: Sec-independent protein translocase protein TatB [Formosimonas sp.]